MRAAAACAGWNSTRNAMSRRSIARSGSSPKAQCSWKPAYRTCAWRARSVPVDPERLRQVAQEYDGGNAADHDDAQQDGEERAGTDGDAGPVFLNVGL